MLNLEAINILPALRAALAAPPERQVDLFRAEVMEPLRPFWEPFMSWMPPSTAGDTGDPAMNAARTFGYYSPLLDAERGLQALDLLDGAGSWPAIVEGVERGWAALQPEAHGITIERLRLSFMLGDPNVMNVDAGSYTGFGAVPGLIIVMAWPTDYNLPRLAAATAHELNHNVRFSYEPFIAPRASVGQYMVIEGLAESFAGELYGHDRVGPWVEGLSGDEIGALKPRFHSAVEITGFDVVRGYIFGDWGAGSFGYEAQGLPNFAGYAMGYHLVQAYLRNTRMTAAQATYVPWQEIVEQSRFF